MSNLNSTALERKVRIRNLLEKGNEINVHAETENPTETINAIRDVIIESNQIINEGDVNERAEHTSEMVMDAQLLKLSYQVVQKVIETGTDFNEGIYQSVISSLVFRDDNANWDALTDIAVKICRTTNFSISMLGSFESGFTEIEKRVKEQKQRAKRSKNEVEQEPESVLQVEKQDLGAKKVKIVLEQIKKAYQKNNFFPIPFFKLVIDPSNFMNTVENAFQVSFLALDGQLSIDTGSDGMPEVTVINPKEVTQIRADTEQSICTLNEETCEKMIEYYNIRQPMIHINR